MPTSEEPFTYDPEAAERGWEATADLRAAIGPSPLPNLNLEDAAIEGLRVAREVRKPHIRSELELLHSKHFDIGLLDRIEAAAWAVWYANDSRFLAEITQQGGRISAATLERSSARRGRMLRVCEYMLGVHPVAGAIVAEIRSGRGYADLATDLTRLARLYVTYESIVSQGGAHYDANDVTGAKADSAQILLELGESDNADVAKAKDEAGRAFAVLADIHSRIRRWAGAIWNDPNFFPSFFAIRYTPSPKGKGGGTDAGGGGEEGGGGGGGGAI